MYTMVPVICVAVAGVSTRKERPVVCMGACVSNE